MADLLKRSLVIRPTNLPAQLTNFIGRERELAEIATLLGRTRLLTLTGPGGSGKTRLALRAASEAIDEFEDGVYFVGLAPIFDPDLVVPTVAQVLGVPDLHGVPPLENLKDSLRDRRLLLLLDNCEQVLGAVPHLTELLAACPRIALLATSRTALRVSGEQELGVPPLTLPDPGRPPLGDDRVTVLGGYEAVQLFVARAHAVKPDFALSADNVEAVAEICRRLDGLPLAIELAAARIRLLPPRAMLARLAGRASVAPDAWTDESGASEQGPAGAAHTPALQFLTGGARDLPARQRTLRDTIAWSHDLLEPSEQLLFRRLAAFVGGCTLEAAEAAVSAAGVGDRRWALAVDEVLDGVESLLAKSLLRRLDAPGDEPRFTMLETIREYGLEQLARAGELRTLRHWHAEYLLALAEEAEPLMRGAEQVAWVTRLEAEHDNLRAALEWSLAAERGAALALRLCGALAWFWASRAHISEGRRWLGRALRGEAAPPPVRLKALYGAGWLAHLQRDSAGARALLEPALALARELDDRWAEAWVLHVLGRVAYYDGDSAAARALGEQSQAAAEAAGDRWLAAWALHLQGLAAHIVADYPRAHALYERALVIRRELGFREGIGVCLQLMGMVAYRLGDYAAAQALLREALPAFSEVQVWSVPTGLATIAGVAARAGQPERAARLAGAVEAFREAVHVNPIPLAEAILDEAVALARGALGDAAYGAAWAAGRALPLEEAVAEALAVKVQPSPERAPKPSDAAPAGLSPRELEVLRLIAAGMTSKEMAEALVVSVPTVERHITHVYTKIGARGRAEATAFALKHGLA